MNDKINIGILGLGTVGSGVVKTLKSFENIDIKAIAVRNLNKKRNIEGLSEEIVTDKAFEVVNNKDIQIIVEVMGGIDPAYELIKTAINNGKHIVTANKELIAKFGKELFGLAKEKNVVILFEAAIAGGIPIIMPLKTILAGNKINKIAGILNGTTNYILTRMEKEKVPYSEVLQAAQDLGYAEADPSGDVQGYDAMYKIATLTSLAFNKRIDLSKIYREGIENITPEDMDYADQLGYKIKLIALGQAYDDNKVDIRVHPMLVNKDHVLANINDVMNSVVIEGHPVGQVMFTGPGAGEYPTASSVVGDILALACEIKVTDYPLPMMRCRHDASAEQIDITETQNKYYLSINAYNVPGVIGQLGLICGKNNINLSSIIQKGKMKDGSAKIVLLTELAYEKNIQKACDEIKNLDATREINNLLRVME